MAQSDSSEPPSYINWPLNIHTLYLALLELEKIDPYTFNLMTCNYLGFSVREMAELNAKSSLSIMRDLRFGKRLLKTILNEQDRSWKQTSNQTREGPG